VFIILVQWKRHPELEGSPFTKGREMQTSVRPALAEAVPQSPIHSPSLPSPVVIADSSMPEYASRI
jgi:hypothetical protein